MMIRDLGIEDEAPMVARSGIEARIAEWQRVGQRAVDRLRARFDVPHFSILKRLRGSFVPRVDLVESEADIHLEIDLPGVDENELEAALRGASLTLRGIRRGGVQEGAKNADRFRRERHTGPFERTVTLPCAVNAARAEARFAHGVLDLRFPKTAAAAAPTPAV